MDKTVKNQGGAGSAHWREASFEADTAEAPSHLYTEEFYSSGNYEDVSLGRFSRYWFSRRYFAALIRRFAPTGGARALLDAGCGLGHLLALLQDDFACTGIDLIDYAVEQARLNAPRAQAYTGDVSDLEGFETGAFSAVVGLGLVEHLERPRDFIREVHRILEPGGIFFFLTGNPEYVMRRFKDPTCDAMGIDPTHINLKIPAVWRAWCQESGFRMERHFSDGLWDVPYLPLLPNVAQAVLFGWPAALQVLARGAFIPLGWGVNQIGIARKPFPA